METQQLTISCCTLRVTKFSPLNIRQWISLVKSFYQFYITFLGQDPKSRLLGQR